MFSQLYHNSRELSCLYWPSLKCIMFFQKSDHCQLLIWCAKLWIAEIDMWDSSWWPCSLAFRHATTAGMECDFTHLPYLILCSGKANGKHRHEDLLYPKSQFEKVFKNANSRDERRLCLIIKNKINLKFLPKCFLMFPKFSKQVVRTTTVEPYWLTPRVSSTISWLCWQQKLLGRLLGMVKVCMVTWP